jgi:DNA-binding transcriptional regulator YhcF (GntR family)
MLIDMGDPGLKSTQLRRRILCYLLDRKCAPGSTIPELTEIAHDLGILKEDISDQLDILESQGAIVANRTFGGHAAPILRGMGKAMLEELEAEEKVPPSKGPIQEETSDSVSNKEAFEYDAFISHATGDKESFVRGLVQKLVGEGIHVWYDEFTLCIGDSLRQSIDRGLAKSRYGIVVLSPSFFKKNWPQKELDGLEARERHGDKVILPVWLNVDKEDVASYSPMLAGIKAAKAVDGIDTVVAQLLKVLKPNFSSPSHAATNKKSGDIEENTQPKQLTNSTKAAYEEKIGSQKSTVFFYERVCDAFPGIRELHIIDDPNEAVSRLCILLRAPLQFKVYCPIWMIFSVGSVSIKSCGAIDKKHVLLQPYELNINKLAIYRPPTYWQYFVYLECAPDEPTGIYPHTTKGYIAQMAKDMGRCYEEYAIGEDQFLTREEYDDGAIFRNGKSISITGAQPRIRYLTPEKPNRVMII